MGPRRNVTIGFSQDEFLRVQGAAAVVGAPVATYLKWLLRGGLAADGLGGHATAILERLDAISVAIGRLPSSPPMRAETPPGLTLAPRELFATKLRERGIPSSTIRQINIVLDELEGKP